jgi:cytochrome b561
MPSKVRPCCIVLESPFVIATPSSAKSPPVARYGAVAIALHWVLGLSILGMFGVGLYMTDLPFSPWRLKLYNWHKWAGVTILVLSVLRLVWRLTHRPPALPQAVTLGMPAWQTRAYHATHHAMYALFFVVPLMGWAYSSAAGFPIVWFGQIPLPDLLPVNKEFAELIKPLHEISAFALVGLAGLHIAAALKHQLIDRDGLLQRMLPGRG